MGTRSQFMYIDENGSVSGWERSLDGDLTIDAFDAWVRARASGQPYTIDPDEIGHGGQYALFDMAPFGTCEYALVISEREKYIAVSWFPYEVIKEMAQLVEAGWTICQDTYPPQWPFVEQHVWPKGWVE